jgi:hypothetical protein
LIFVARSVPSSGSNRIWFSKSYYICNVHAFVWR